MSVLSHYTSFHLDDKAVCPSLGPFLSLSSYWLGPGSFSLSLFLESQAHPSFNFPT
jgi:hypothetical protein